MAVSIDYIAQARTENKNVYLHQPDASCNAQKDGVKMAVLKSYQNA